MWFGRLSLVLCTAAAVAVTTLVPVGVAQSQSTDDPAQAKRLETLKAAGRKASLTIYAVRVIGKPDRNVADALGLVLEHSGMENLESAPLEFAPPADATWDRIPALFGDFLKKNAPTTDYALYAEYLGEPKTGPTEVRFLIATSKGETVFVDSQKSDDKDFKRTAARDPDPMGCSVLVAERVFGQLKWKKGEGGEDGKFARLWAQKSGTPTKAERAEMAGRVAALKKELKTAKLSVFATRIGDSGDAASADRLAKAITKQIGLQAAATEKPIDVKLQPTSNEMKRLWDLARALRDHLRVNPVETEYALLAEYAINPAGGPAHAVHFVVCKNKGDYVIVDLQNDQWPDFQRIDPKSVEDCDRLATERLAGMLK